MVGLNYRQLINSTHILHIHNIINMNKAIFHRSSHDMKAKERQSDAENEKKKVRKSNKLVRSMWFLLFPLFSCVYVCDIFFFFSLIFRSHVGFWYLAFSISTVKWMASIIGLRVKRYKNAAHTHMWNDWEYLIYKAVDDFTRYTYIYNKLLVINAQNNNNIQCTKAIIHFSLVQRVLWKIYRNKDLYNAHADAWHWRL